MTVVADGTTTLAGPLADQAALHGVLRKIRDLGLTLLSVERQHQPGRSQHDPPCSAPDAWHEARRQHLLG